MCTAKFHLIFKFLLVISLAGISCYAWIGSDGVIGEGWGILAVLILFFYDVDYCKCCNCSNKENNDG